MKNNRRNFLKFAGIAGIGMAGSNISRAFSFPAENGQTFLKPLSDSVLNATGLNDENLSIIGPIGAFVVQEKGMD
jgi:hypothetical protein